MTREAVPTDGVLVIDKPAGLTSHDVVIVARRLLGERRIGHTGTLDPMATGVLALACGRATRLVQFLVASDKEYVAQVRFGIATDTYDCTGRETARTDDLPSADAIERSFDACCGDQLQLPPPVSAKKIAGRRAYALARAGEAPQPAPVHVRLDALQVQSIDGPVATVRLRCSSGFYVRALAHAVGQRVGTGACLQALRRTRSGEFALSAAVTLEALQRNPAQARTRIEPMEQLLAQLPSAVLTADGLERVRHGRDVGTEHLRNARPSGAPPWVRLVSEQGALVALAMPRGFGVLHPSVVLS
jgi:tRNA pseudouridine55 synthase